MATATKATKTHPPLRWGEALWALWEVADEVRDLARAERGPPDLERPLDRALARLGNLLDQIGEVDEIRFPLR